MLRHSVLGSSRFAQPTHVMPPRASKPLYSCSWLHCASAVVLCVLSLVWGIRGVAAAEQAGFSKHCAGLAQDPLLGPSGLTRPSAMWRSVLPPSWPWSHASPCAARP